jgi:hypothetical protein
VKRGCEEMIFNSAQRKDGKTSGKEIRKQMKRTRKYHEGVPFKI